MKRKVLSIIGARPQIIKSSPVSREIRKYFKEILLHTGQHYDENMSQVFFDTLKISRPDYNLNIGSGTHATQTAKMMIGIENMIFKEKPNIILIYGDTNSTIAGALVGAKLDIPVVHIEAGLRSFNKKMPEELNRICTDHLSEVLFCPCNKAVENLKKENICKNVFNVGDVMKDAVLENVNKIKMSESLKKIGIKENFYFMTIHRQENTDNLDRLRAIIEITDKAKHDIIFSIHPRTKIILELNKLNLPNKVKIIAPVNYFESLTLQKLAKLVITDSGGIQKEACFLKTPCITLRDETEWTETIDIGVNKIVGVDYNKFRLAEDYFLNNGFNEGATELYGDGTASNKIASTLEKIYG